MTSNDILKADLLDIIFDNRNKQYGAYTLRRDYNLRLMIALGAALGAALCSLLFLGDNVSSSKIISHAPDDVIVRNLKVADEMPKLPQLPRQKSVAAPAVQQQRYTKYLIQPDDKVTQPVADQRSLLNSLVSIKTLPGLPPGTGDFPQVKDPVPGGAGNGEIKNNFIPEERDPEFPGGQEAWLNFLRKNLSAPDGLEVGEKKSVLVRFLVSVDGTVTGFEIVQSAGKSFDNEVIRVLKKMPRWKPAIQNGMAVVKYYTQPVTFIGLEQ